MTVVIPTDRPKSVRNRSAIGFNLVHKWFTQDEIGYQVSFCLVFMTQSLKTPPHSVSIHFIVGMELRTIHGSPFPKLITFLFEDQISSLLFLSFAKRWCLYLIPISFS